MAKNAEKNEAEPQQTPKAGSEEPKGARYITRPVRLADLPRLIGRKPIDASRRLFLKFTFVALAAPGSFAVIPGRGFGHDPGCNDLEGDLGDPGTGCNPPETNSCTEESICMLNRTCDGSPKNVCDEPGENVCGTSPVMSNVCKGSQGANECQVATANTCHSPGSNKCETYHSNSCQSVSDSNSCSLSTANTCNGTTNNICTVVGANAEGAP